MRRSSTGTGPADGRRDGSSPPRRCGWPIRRSASAVSSARPRPRAPPARRSSSPWPRSACSPPPCVRATTPPHCTCSRRPSAAGNGPGAGFNSGRRANQGQGDDEADQGQFLWCGSGIVTGGHQAEVQPGPGPKAGVGGSAGGGRAGSMDAVPRRGAPPGAGPRPRRRPTPRTAGISARIDEYRRRPI